MHEYVRPAKRIIGEPELRAANADKVHFRPSAGRHAAEAGEEKDAQTSGREGMWEMRKTERQISAKLRTHKTMLITAGADSFIFMRWS